MMTNKLKHATSVATAFTLIELLVVVSIIAVLVSILLPAMSAARAGAQALRCLSNVRQQAEMTLIYCQANEDFFPTRTATSAAGGGSVYGAAMPTRTILTYDLRPIDILTCPMDQGSIRDYPVGDLAGNEPNGLGIGDLYGLSPATKVRFSYGVNNMTGIEPSTPEEEAIFNSHLVSYKHPERTLLYADCAWINARGSNVSLNDEPRLKGRVANAAAPIRMNTLPSIPPEYAAPDNAAKRHAKGSNVAFMDLHAESVSQDHCLTRLLYSWTEPRGSRSGIPIPLLARSQSTLNRLF